MDKKLKDIGELKGKLLIFGGVYSNLQALHSLKGLSENLNISPENCICTGDIVGYCAQPEETIQFFRNWGARSIAGNVEIQLANDEEDCGCDFREGSRCDNFSKEWYPYAKMMLSKESVKWMSELPEHIQFRYGGKIVFVVHGSYFNTSEFIFKSTNWERKQPNFEHTKSDIILAGHCGLPFSDSENEKLWINPGVIGMPANDGSVKTWYGVLDENSDSFMEFQQLEYDHEKTSSLMLSNNLPAAYAETLVTGIWDNLEILPEEEASRQGDPIAI